MRHYLSLPLIFMLLSIQISSASEDESEYFSAQEDLFDAHSFTQKKTKKRYFSVKSVPVNYFDVYNEDEIKLKKGVFTYKLNPSDVCVQLNKYHYLSLLHLKSIAQFWSDAASNNKIVGIRFQTLGLFGLGYENEKFTLSYLGIFSSDEEIKVEMTDEQKADGDKQRGEELLGEIRKHLVFQSRSVVVAQKLKTLGRKRISGKLRCIVGV